VTRNLRWVAAAVMIAASVGVVVGGAYRPTAQPAAVGLVAAIVAAALTALIIGLGLSRPWWGMLLFCAAMPIVNVARAQLWIGPIQVIPATLVIAALVLGTMLHRAANGQLAAPSRPARMPWLALAAAVALAIAASLVTPWRGDAVNITLHGVLEPMAVFAVVVALRPRTNQALQALVAVAAGVTIATLINFVWLVLLIGPRDLYFQRMLLARLTYFNVGIFANVLVTAIPAAASVLFLRSRFRWPRAAVSVAAFAIGLMMVALFFTYTKSAWLSAAVVASLLIVLLVRGWRRRIPLLLAVAVLLALVVPYPLSTLRAVAPDVALAYETLLVTLQGEGRVESWDPDTYQGSGSIGIRLEALGAAAELTAGSPLFGVGPGGFQREFARIRPDASVPELQSAHNMLPNLAAEYGLPFALLVAIGLALTIIAALRMRRENVLDRRVVGSALAVALIGFLCMATLFGVDLYRTYRTMNTDVVTAALLAGVAWSVAGGWPRTGERLAAEVAPGDEGGQAVEQPSQLGATGGDELAIGRP
jgi:O-antigen ligase